MNIFEYRKEIEELDTEFDDRMGTAYNGLSYFFQQLDLAFPPYEKGTHSTRMHILADAMKRCRVKMEQSMGRKCTDAEKEVLQIHTHMD